MYVHTGSNGGTKSNGSTVVLHRRVEVPKSRNNGFVGDS